MKRTLISIVAGIALLLGGRAFPQDKKASESAEKAKDTSAQTTTEKPKPTAEELEGKFKAMLTKATLTGRWCSIKDGALGPEKEDKYTIIGASKVGGDAWIINARVQYGKKDFVAPIPVQVKWAGDTHSEGSDRGLLRRRSANGQPLHGSSRSAFRQCPKATATPECSRGQSR